MRYWFKKIRLISFLCRRVPRYGCAQAWKGLRDRKTGYLAMELAEILPPVATTIVDVGTHAGDVAQALDFLYNPRRIWLFEPNPAHGPALEARFGRDDRFTLTTACLGDSERDVTFNIHAFDAASSLFECRPGQLAALGFSEGRHTTKVPMTTLSKILPSDLASLDLLKLDCQGAELAVLKGAGDRLRSIRWIYCEVSFDPIYLGAPLFGEVHAFLRESGFELRHLGGCAGSGASIEWADALYANTAIRPLPSAS